MNPTKLTWVTIFTFLMAMVVYGQSSYRNIALNTKDVHAAGHGYPHASSNSEYPYPPGAPDTTFFALNAINGDTLNTGHGSMAYASWGPQMIDGLWWRVDFGHDVQVDKVKIWMRADWGGNPGHDSYWKQATLVFSDSSKVNIAPDSVKFGQEFPFSSRVTNSLTITNLVPNRNVWCGFTEVQVWGYDPPTSVISPLYKAKNGMVGKTQLCFVSGGSARYLELPQDAQGAELYSLQGKRVWSCSRAAGSTLSRVALPPALAKGIFQVKFL
jgi:hypothetical protein